MLYAVDDPRRALKNEGMNQTVGNRVRKLRLDRGWRQDELAKKAKVAQGTVQTMETGKRVPRWASIVKVAKALDTTAEALVQPDAIAAQDPDVAGLLREDLKVARAYNAASTQVRHRVLALLRQRELSTEGHEDSPESRASVAAELEEIGKLLATVDGPTRARLMDLFRSTIHVLRAPDRDRVATVKKQKA